MFYLCIYLLLLLLLLSGKSYVHSDMSQAIMTVWGADGHKAQSTNPHKFPSPLQPKKRIIRTTHGRRGPAPQFPTPHQIRGCHNNILEYDLREHQLTVVFSTLTGQHPLSPLQRVV